MTDNVDDMSIEALTTHFRENRARLGGLRAPTIQMWDGSDADREYRLEQGLSFALSYIDIVLHRLSAYEERFGELETRL